MKPRRLLLVVNPASGDRTGETRLKKLVRLLEKNRWSVTVRLTAGPGDATRIAREEGPGFDTVAGAGGDGTLNEVLNGMVGSGVPLGLIPWGTGNVFAKEMGFPRRPKKLVKILTRGTGCRFDLGKAGNRYFLLMAGAGFDAAALGRVEGAPWKKRLGKLSYGIGALTAFRDYRPAVIDVVLDGAAADRGTWVLVSNTRLYGAFFTVQPAADPTDGLLDVFVFRDQGRWAFAGFLFRMAVHTFFGPRGTVRKSFGDRHGFHRARSVALNSAGAVPVQVDGDPEGRLPLTIGVVPGAVTILVPKRTARRLGQVSGKSDP